MLDLWFRVLDLRVGFWRKTEKMENEVLWLLDLRSCFCRKLDRAAEMKKSLKSCQILKLQWLGIHLERFLEVEGEGRGCISSLERFWMKGKNLMGVHMGHDRGIHHD